MNKQTKGKIILPILIFLAFVTGSIWTYLVMNQLNTGKASFIGNSGNSYTISENSIADAVA